MGASGERIESAAATKAAKRRLQICAEQPQTQLRTKTFRIRGRRLPTRALFPVRTPSVGKRTNPSDAVLTWGRNVSETGASLSRSTKAPVGIGDGARPHVGDEDVGSPGDLAFVEDLLDAVGAALADNSIVRRGPAAMAIHMEKVT